MARQLNILAHFYILQVILLLIKISVGTFPSPHTFCLLLKDAL